MPVCWFPQPRFAGWQLLMSLAVSCYSHSGSYFLAHPWYCILSYRILWVFFFPIYLIYTIRYTLPVATHAFQWGKENIQVCRHPPLASRPASQPMACYLIGSATVISPTELWDCCAHALTQLAIHADCQRHSGAYALTQLAIHADCQRHSGVY